MTGRIRIPDNTAGNLIHSSHSPAWASVRVGDFSSKWLTTSACRCFGGARKNRLLMAASQSLYSFYVNTEGAQTP